MFAFRQQYRQIDFLRLFRLCRSMGVAKRKRKMPIEYNDDSKAAAVGRRLLKSLLEKEVFNGWKINMRSESICLYIKIEDRAALLCLRSVFNSTDRFYAYEEKAREAMAKYNEIAAGSQHVRPYMPYEIKITTRRLHRPEYKPTNNFFKCALEVIEYKRLWDSNIKIIRDFYAFYTEREREMLREANKLAEGKWKGERLAVQHEENEQIDGRESVQRQQVAQNRFDEALERFRNRGGCQ